MPDGVFDDIGMPPGAVAKRLGVEGYLHKKKTPDRTSLFCGDSRSRTDDPLLAKQML